MKHKLVLSLTAEHLALELLQPAAPRAMVDQLRDLLRRKQSPNPVAPHKVLARIDLTTPITPASLPSVLEQAVVSLKAIDPKPLVRIDFEARLGLSHAQLGLLALADTQATPTASACEAYAQAWVRQMWHLEPANQVIRWELLDDAYKLLISSIDRQIFDSLGAFASQHGLRFVSCKPAVLCELEAQAHQGPNKQPDEADCMTLVWTEAGSQARRTGNVQLLRLKGGQLASIWRGWLPPSIADESDQALDGAVRRFQAHHLAQPGDALRSLHWPAVSAVSASS